MTLEYIDRLEYGKTYKFRDDLEGRKEFPFGHKYGTFIGRTPKTLFPRFKLNEQGRECFVNLQDNCFELVQTENIVQPSNP